MNRTKGILLTILAASSFGLIPLFAKIAYANGFNPYTFTLFRSLFASVEIFIYIKINNIDYRVEKEQCITLFKVSLIGYSLMMLTLSISYNYMSTGLATTIHFIYPVVVMLGSIVFYNEKTNKQIIFALIMSLVGMYFLVGFGSMKSISIIGILLSLFSGIFYAYYVLKVAYGNIKDINSFVLAFYVSLFNTYILFMMTIFMRKLSMNYTYKGLLSTALVALVCNLIGMVSFQAGLKIISATTATILSTFEPITSLIVGVLVFREVLLWYHIVGSSLIIVSVIVVAYAEKKLKSTPENNTISKQNF